MMPQNILILGLGDRCVNVVVEGGLPVREAKARICSLEGVQTNWFYLTHNGCPLEESGVIEGNGDYSTTVVKAHPVVRGGKGGFGSLIRAMGMQINKSNKKEACRDLSGRRMRDVNAEKKITKWLKEEPERQRKLVEEKRKRLEKRRAEPKHYFDDPSYMEQIKSTEESMDDALKQGLEASSSTSRKRKHKEPLTDDGTSSKKPKLWLGVHDADLDSDSDGDGSYDEEEGGEGASGTSREPYLGSAGSLSSSDESQETRARPDSEAGPSGLQPVASGENSGSQMVVSNSSEQMSKENSTGEEVAMPGEEGSRVPDQQPAMGVPEDTEVAVTLTQTQRSEETGNDKESELVNLDGFSSAEELESVGAERLKVSLQALGLKCGGTLQERAQRLFSTKGKEPKDLAPSLFAKAGRQRRGKNK